MRNPIISGLQPGRIHTSLHSYRDKLESRNVGFRNETRDIMITSRCNVYPLTPHFYIVKVGFIAVFIIFLYLL